MSNNEGCVRHATLLSPSMTVVADPVTSESGTGMVGTAINGVRVAAVLP